MNEPFDCHSYSVTQAQKDMNQLKNHYNIKIVKRNTVYELKQREFKLEILFPLF